MVNIVIAINPYKQVKIYGDEIIAQYSGVKQTLFHKLPPHVYAVAEAAYRNLINKGENQSMIVCGESGSGKTESAKLLMRHLAYTTQQNASEEKSGGTPNKKEGVHALIIEQQVLAANPILESIGNAKTGMNNNSSRFGKFNKILFSSLDEGGRIVGSYIETYLLEKSRVVRQDKGERNYHVFYQILKGLSPALKKEFRLKTVKDYAYLHDPKAANIDGVSDERRFEELQSAMDTLLIPKEEQEQIFRVVAGVLHLGNAAFESKEDSLDSVSLTKASEVDVENAAHLLGVPADALKKRLLTRNIKVARSVIEKPLNKQAAVVNRDAMAKALYNSLFKWVVARINIELYSADDEDNEDQDISNLLWIGILDVFGFEHFVHNSFEQFCINFANERLQQYFNYHVIKSEQEEYTREGIFWTPIEIPDNNDTIDLVDLRPHGIISLLDSTCQMPKGSDDIFTANMFEQHRKHPCLRLVRNIKTGKGTQSIRINGFAIKHYAGEVTYDADSFVAKNTDNSEEGTVDLFCKSSKFKVVQELLLSELNTTGRSNKRFRSVGTVFSNQLTLLVKQLQSTTPYFVRCINPNDKKKPNHFVDEYVAKQLRCGGLIEALRILKLGYPTRAPYDKIYDRYGVILKNSSHVNKRDFCEAVLYAFDLGKEDYALGLTKVFFKPNKQEFMEKILRDNSGSLPPDIVRKIRKYLTRKRIMRVCGVMKAFGRWTVRMYRFRAIRKLRNATGVLNVANKAILSKVRFLRTTLAAETLQACFRMAIQNRRLADYLSKKDAALYIWMAYRKYRFRRNLNEAVAKRIQSKRSAAETARLEKERELRKQEEAQREAEKEERAKAAKYFPDRPTVPYLAELSPIVEEVASWIAAVNERSIEGDLFDALRDGVVLGTLSTKIDSSKGRRPNTKARPGNFFAKDNITKFVQFCSAIGVAHEQIFSVADLVQFKEPTRILNTLMNLQIIAAVHAGHMPSPTVEAELDAARAIDGMEERLMATGISFFDSKGKLQSVAATLAAEEEKKREEEARKKKEEEERLAREEVERRKKVEEEVRKAREAEEARRRRDEEERRKKEKEEAERKQREEEEARRAREAEEKKKEEEREASRRRAEEEAREDAGLNRNNLPRPAKTPRIRTSRREAQQQEEGYFSMTTAAVLRTLEEEGVVDREEWKTFNSEDMYKIAKQEGIEWHQWHNWVKDRIMASLLIATMQKKKAAARAPQPAPTAAPKQRSERRAATKPERRPSKVQSGSLEWDEDESSSEEDDGVAFENRRLREQLAEQSKQLEKALAMLNSRFGEEPVLSDISIDDEKQPPKKKREQGRRASVMPSSKPRTQVKPKPEESPAKGGSRSRHGPRSRSVVVQNQAEAARLLAAAKVVGKKPSSTRKSNSESHIETVTEEEEVEVDVNAPLQTQIDQKLLALKRKLQKTGSTPNLESQRNLQKPGGQKKGTPTQSKPPGSQNRKPGEGKEDDEEECVIL